MFSSLSSLLYPQFSSLSSLSSLVFSSLTYNCRIKSMKWYPPGTIKRLYWIPSMQKNPDLLFNFFPLVTHFTLSKNYNDPIGKIPPGMLQINWGRTFNHPLPPLPAQITHLVFGDYFQQHIPSLPSNLTHLRLGTCYTRSLPYLPQTLTHITIASNSKQCPLLDSPLPNLRCLDLQETRFDSPISVEHYSQLTHLALPINSPIPPLPPLLTYLHLGSRFNEPVNDLPTSLTRLIFPYVCDFDRPLPKLPPSLTHLILGSVFNHPIDSLPPSLTYLYFDNFFNKSINNLPLTLTHLVLESSCRHSNVHTLPPSLTHLYSHHLFFSPSVLPSTLTHLSTMDFPLSFHLLPPSLTHLAIGGRDLHPTNYVTTLPAHVVYLSVPITTSTLPDTNSNVNIVYRGDILFWKPRPPMYE